MPEICLIGYNHDAGVVIRSMMIIALYGCPPTARAKTDLLNAINAFGNRRLASCTDLAEAQDASALRSFNAAQRRARDWNVSVISSDAAVVWGPA